MYSLSKTTVSVEQAQAIVAHHFGSACRLANLTELTDGCFNAAYCLQFDDGPAGGQRSVLKVAPPSGVQVLRYERDIMAAEVAALRLVRAHTGIPVPEVLVHDASRTLLASEFFVMGYVPGVPFHKLRGQWPAEDRQAIDRLAGGYLRQMNEISGDRFGCYAGPAPAGAGWRTAFAQLVEWVLLDGEEMGVALDRPYAELRACLSAHYPALDEVRLPRLVHWDLWDGNIFVDPSAPRITGIVDFERVLWADPLMECNFAAFEVQPAFLEGYGAPAGPAWLDQPLVRTRRALYNIYLYLIMAIEPYYRHYATNDQENWARGRLAQELDRLERA